MTTCFKPSRRAASETRAGSLLSRGNGLAVVTAQKWQALVQRSEIRNQNFDNNSGVSRADRCDGLPEMIGSAIGQIITRHRCDDDVFQTKPAGRFRDPGRLAAFQGKRLGGRDRAKMAGPRAAI